MSATYRKPISFKPNDKPATMFVAGVGTSQLVDKLLEKQYELVLNDISEQALNTLKSRLGAHHHLKGLACDISKPLPVDVPKVDIWFDRLFCISCWLRLTLMVTLIMYIQPYVQRVMFYW